MPIAPTVPKVRLFVGAGLEGGAALDLDGDQSHYVGSVMRLREGEAVRLFNGRDGEWRARIATLTRKAASLSVEEQLRAQTQPPALRLLLAPLKKARFDFAVEKAVELGVGRISPVFTAHTDTGRVNAERLRALAREAAEQCERLNVPAVDEVRPLRMALDAWPKGAILFHADETGRGRPLAQVLADSPAGPHAFLIGPEGGFDAAELEMLRSLPFSLGVGLGPRVLRAETAVCAALAIYQAIVGDAGDSPQPR